MCRHVEMSVCHHVEMLVYHHVEVLELLAVEKRVLWSFVELPLDVYRKLLCSHQPGHKKLRSLGVRRGLPGCFKRG